jgi:hypothetical protein
VEKRFFKYLAVIIIYCFLSFKTYCIKPAPAKPAPAKPAPAKPAPAKPAPAKPAPAKPAEGNPAESKDPAFKSPEKPLRLRYQSCTGSNLKKAIPIINMFCKNNDLKCVFPESYVRTDSTNSMKSINNRNPNPLIGLLIDADTNFQTNTNSINAKTQKDRNDLKIPEFSDKNKFLGIQKTLNNALFLQKLVTNEFKDSPLAVKTATLSPYYASWKTLCGIDSVNKGVAQIILPSAPFATESCGSNSNCLDPFVNIRPIPNTNEYNYCNNVYNFFNNNYSAGSQIGTYLPYNVIANYGSNYFNPILIKSKYEDSSCVSSKITKEICETMDGNYSNPGKCSNVSQNDCIKNNGEFKYSSCTLISDSKNNTIAGSVNAKTDKSLCQSVDPKGWISEASGSNCILNDINKCHSIMGVYNSRTGACNNILENNCSYHDNTYFVENFPVTEICVGKNLTDNSYSNSPLNSSSRVPANQIKNAISYCKAGIDSLNSSLSSIITSYNTSMKDYNKSLNDNYANFTETVIDSISKKSLLDNSLNQFVLNLYLWNIANVIRDALNSSSSNDFNPIKIQNSSRCSLFNPISKTTLSNTLISTTCDNSALNDYSANYKNTLDKHKIEYASWLAKSSPDARGNLVYKDTRYEALFNNLVSFNNSIKTKWSESRPDLQSLITFLKTTAARKTKINNLYDYLSYFEISTNKPTNLEANIFAANTTNKKDCEFAGGELSSSNSCNCPKEEEKQQFFNYIDLTCGPQVNDSEAVAQILYQKLAGDSTTESNDWFNNLKPVFSIDPNNQFLTNNYYTQNSVILNNYISQSFGYLMKKMQTLCGSSIDSFLVDSSYFNKSLKTLVRYLENNSLLNNLLMPIELFLVASIGNTSPNSKELLERVEEKKINNKNLIAKESDNLNKDTFTRKKLGLGVESTLNKNTFNSVDLSGPKTANFKGQGQSLLDDSARIRRTLSSTEMLLPDRLPSSSKNLARTVDALELKKAKGLGTLDDISATVKNSSKINKFDQGLKKGIQALSRF